MKKYFVKYIAVFAIFCLMTVACLPITSNAADYNYEKSGLEALYIGNNNTGNGQDKNATVWKDLSGKSVDIKSVPKDSKSYFTDTGYHLDTQKVFFEGKIKDIVNGNEFTVEVNLGDITSKGTQWNTLVNSTNDSFSLYRLIAEDSICVKSQTDSSKANKRPKAANGLDLLKNSTVTVTYKVGGKIIVYVDGVKVAQEDAQYNLNCGDFFFGHDGAERCYATEFRAIRIYSKELTAAQVKANYAVDKEILGKPYQGGTTSTPATSTDTSSAAASAPTSESSSTASKVETSSVASSTSNSSSAASSKSASSTPASASSASQAASSSASSGSTTGESNSTYIYIIIGVVAVAIVVAVVIFLKKKK
jgi:LPXTG-motif cell wall-anchored protein